MHTAMEELLPKALDTRSGLPDTFPEPGSPVAEHPNATSPLAEESLVDRYSPEPPAAIIYLVQARCRKAVKQLRSLLISAGLTVISEVDATAALRSSFGVDLTPSQILFVTCPVLLLHAVVTGASLLTTLPVHIVVIEKGQWTRIYVMNPARIDAAIGGALTLKLHQLSSRILQCLDQLGARIPGQI